MNMKVLLKGKADKSFENIHFYLIPQINLFGIKFMVKFSVIKHSEGIGSM